MAVFSRAASAFFAAGSGSCDGGEDGGGALRFGGALGGGGHGRGRARRRSLGASTSPDVVFAGDTLSALGLTDLASAALCTCDPAGEGAAAAATWFVVGCHSFCCAAATLWLPSRAFVSRRSGVVRAGDVDGAADD